MMRLIQACFEQNRTNILQYQHQHHSITLASFQIVLSDPNEKSACLWRIKSLKSLISLQFIIEGQWRRCVWMKVEQNWCQHTHHHTQGYVVNWELESQIWDRLFGNSAMKVKLSICDLFWSALTSTLLFQSRLNQKSLHFFSLKPSFLHFLFKSVPLMRCDVMWCDVMWCDVMWCDVMWCDVMWCDVMCITLHTNFARLTESNGWNCVWNIWLPFILSHPPQPVWQSMDIKPTKSVFRVCSNFFNPLTITISKLVHSHHPSLETKFWNQSNRTLIQHFVLCCGWLWYDIMVNLLNCYLWLATTQLYSRVPKFHQRLFFHLCDAAFWRHAHTKICSKVRLIISIAVKIAIPTTLSHSQSCVGRVATFDLFDQAQSWRQTSHQLSERDYIISVLIFFLGVAFFFFFFLRIRLQVSLRWCFEATLIF